MRTGGEKRLAFKLKPEGAVDLKRFVQTMAAVVITVMAVTGCAKNAKDFGLASQDDLAKVRAEMAAGFVGVRGEVAAQIGGVNEAVAQLRTEQGTTAGSLTKVTDRVTHVEAKTSTLAVNLAAQGDRLGKVEGRTNVLEAGIGALRTDLDKTNQAVAALRGDVNKHLDALGKRVVGVRQDLAKVGERTGVLEDTAGYDHSKLGLKIGPFAYCKANDTGDDVVSGFELTMALKSQVEAAIARFKKESMTIKASVGFADDAPFQGKDGKPLANSNDLNEKCSEKRAEAMAEYLNKALAASAAAGTIPAATITQVGRGTATRFGLVDMNRRVMLYAEK